MPSKTSPPPPVEPATFHVAIVGGGIGGLTCALSLAQHCPGLQISVFEQAPAYKEIGAGIGISVNAAKILHKLGVGKAANAISGQRNGMHRSMRRWDNGAEIVTVEAMDEPGETRQLSVHRAEFLEVLYQAIKERGIARLFTNKKAIKVEETSANEVAISFADGTSATANLVVAADGIHSTIRSQFATDTPRYSGRIAYRGLLPLSEISETWPFASYAVSWLAPNKHFLVFPVSRNKTLNVVAFVTKPEQGLGELRESWTSSAPRSELEAEYAGWDPTLQHVISCMGHRPGKWRLNDRELLSQWTYMDGKVVLLGDAAHAMLPHQGSGAGHAIEDGYILGLSLRDYFLANFPLHTHQAHSPPSPPTTPSDSPSSTPSFPSTLETWTQVYQSVRLPRAQKAQITSRQAGDVYELQGPDFEGLSYEEGLPIIERKLKGRMKWVWGGDILAEYDAVAGKVKG